MKRLPALLFALATTAVIGIAMFAIGVNALFNKNSIPVLDSTGVSSVSAASLPADQQQGQQMLDQLQQLVNQYQDREKQYQAQLNDAAQKLDQANQQLDAANQQINEASQMISSYQNLLQELQRRGLIRITNDGRILIQRGSAFGSDD